MVATVVVSSLVPALEVTPGTTVQELRHALLAPGGPNAAVVRDDEGVRHVLDALEVLRSDAPGHSSALLLRCCTPSPLELGDDLGTMVEIGLGRPEGHRGHDLLFETEWGPRLLPMTIVTALVAARAAAAHQSDALTGLPGRGAITAHLDDVLAGDRRRVAVAFIDLDGFKEVNDLHGHAVGDRVLEIIGRRLRAGLRGEDRVGRIGGDEFLAVLDVDDVTDARAAATQLVAELTDPIEQTNSVVRVGVSVGVALAALAPGLDAQRMIADADALMFLAKQDGGGVLVAGDEDDVVVTRSQLDTAISGNTLQMQYQPIVPLDGSEPEAVEALVRWPQPDGGSLRPGAFIPLAEATGQIVDLDWWALHTAIRHLASWDESGETTAPRRVHVNLSALTLAMPGLVSHVERLVSMAGISPDRLTLEVNGATVVADSSRTRDVLHALRDLGVGTAIDDFGIGRSSFSQVSELPVSALKIDRTFVQRLTSREVDRSVVRMIRALADELELEVIAEGVESWDQAEVLRDLGVTHAQGWLWARAIDAWSVASELPRATMAAVRDAGPAHTEDASSAAGPAEPPPPPQPARSSGAPAVAPPPTRPPTPPTGAAAGDAALPPLPRRDGERSHATTLTSPTDLWDDAAGE